MPTTQAKKKEEVMEKKEDLIISEDQRTELLAMVDKKIERDAQTAAGREDVQVEHEGSKITLPADPTAMELTTAIKVLKRKKDEDEQTVEVHETIDTFPWEGAYLFYQAMKAVFGWVGVRPTPGMFGPQPPTFIDVEIAHGVSVQVPWGSFSVPGMDGYLSCSAGRGKDKMVFVIGGSIYKKDLPTVKRIAEATRQLLKDNSIYQGGAFRMNTKNGRLDMDNPPNFLDLTDTDKAVLVFNQDVMEQIDTNLFTPIQYTAQTKKLGVPIKRGVLLEGKYGTGKTQTAYLTADKAVKNGWTFIMVDDVKAIAPALEFARRYQPCVVFAEDIDRSTHGATRTTDIDTVLNTIDGIESKNTDIITVLTTNHVEDINPAMLRPGRLDAVISINAPDADTVGRLIAHYGRGHINMDEPSITQACQELAGQIPAIVREVVERAKLYALTRTGGEFDDILSGSDILAAAKGMKSHLDLIENGHLQNEKIRQETPTLEKVFTTMFRTMLAGDEAVNKIPGIDDVVREIHDQVS